MLWTSMRPQYASIAREMWETGSYLEVYHRGMDYLDKPPPLLFWLSSTSIGILGLSNFAYKLPAVLVIILGVYSTFRFSSLYYSRKTSIYAALILATTQAMFLVTNDVRTDGMLTGFIIFAMWQLMAYLKEGRWKNLLLGSVGVAAAMLTKGPIGIVLVAMGLGGDLLLKRDWRGIFKWQWLVLLIVVALLLAPMTYGLYTQFDLHPEKEVYGLTGPSGVRFFYWTQSFGRITGEIYWKNDAGFFFFFHTILWDFMPWILFLIPALYNRGKTLFTQKLKIEKDQEMASFSLFLLGFLALSTSGFKLPHYIFPLFPFASVMVADYILGLDKKKIGKRLAQAQFYIMHLLFIAVVLAFIFFFNPANLILPLFFLIAYTLFWIIYMNLKDYDERIIFSTLGAVIPFGIAMALYFYPNLLRYQSESNAAHVVAKKELEMDQFYLYQAHAHTLDFYTDRIVPGFNPKKKHAEGCMVFTDADGMTKLTKDGRFVIYQEFNEYNITGLGIEFLLKSSREEHLEKRYLLIKE